MIWKVALVTNTYLVVYARLLSALNPTKPLPCGRLHMLVLCPRQVLQMGLTPYNDAPQVFLRL